MTENSDPEIATHYLSKHNWDVIVSQVYSRKLSQTILRSLISKISGELKSAYKKSELAEVKKEM